ncbi:hypothetical protein [Curvibacter lanceolatus]|uniref:hypothetical protein n=1 Tax=Curvibacter lanceolatus TaxID=86182 RepID=UPI00035D7087|nr:hypothetical protein [Curvibacter lanceolatus]
MLTLPSPSSVWGPHHHLWPPRCHDLLQLAPAACARLARSGPGWLAAALQARPWGLVRQGPRPAGAVPIELQGLGPAQRHADWVEAPQVQACLQPAQLLQRWCAGAARGSAAWPEGLQATGQRLHSVLSTLGLGDAGPTGAWALALASGAPCPADAQAGRSLGLVIRPAALPAPAEAAQWLHTLALAAAPWPLGVTLDSPAGALALAELSRLAQDLCQLHGPVRIGVRDARGEQQLSWAELQARCRPTEQTPA